MPSIPSDSSFKTTFYPYTHTHTFFAKPGVQGMVIISKGGYPTTFSAHKTMQFYRTGHWIKFIKLGRKHATKGGIELAIVKSLREVLIEALPFGFGVTELVLCCLVAVGNFFVHSVSYDANKQAYNQAKELKVFIVELGSEII
jgi:hypothetical protein